MLTREQIEEIQSESPDDIRAEAILSGCGESGHHRHCDSYNAALLISNIPEHLCHPLLMFSSTYLSIPASSRLERRFASSKDFRYFM